MSETKTEKTKGPSEEQLDTLSVLYRTRLVQGAAEGNSKSGPKVALLLKQAGISKKQWQVYCGLKGGKARAIESLGKRITPQERNEFQKTLLVAYQKVQELISQASINDLKALTEFVASMLKIEGNIIDAPKVQINNSNANVPKIDEQLAKLPSLDDLEIDKEKHN